MTTVSGGCQGYCFCGGKGCKVECFGWFSDIMGGGDCMVPCIVWSVICLLWVLGIAC